MRNDTPEIKIEPLRPELAEALRIICTNLGIAEKCQFRPCLRTKRCSTRHVLCWQYLRYEINPLIQRALAYNWQARVAAGEVVNMPPVKEHDFQRLLEREREENPEEAARFAAGAARAVAEQIAAERKAARKATRDVDAASTGAAAADPVPQRRLRARSSP
jgi:hypothetical protein